MKHTIVYALQTPGFGFEPRAESVEADSREEAEDGLYEELAGQMSEDPDEASVYNFWVMTTDGEKRYGQEPGEWDDWR